MNFKCKWCKDTKKIKMFTSIVECLECKVNQEILYIPKNLWLSYVICYIDNYHIFMVEESKNNLIEETTVIYTSNSSAFIKDILYFINSENMYPLLDNGQYLGRDTSGDVYGFNGNGIRYNYGLTGLSQIYLLNEIEKVNSIIPAAYDIWRRLGFLN